MLMAIKMPKTMITFSANVRFRRLFFFFAMIIHLFFLIYLKRDVFIFLSGKGGLQTDFTRH